MKIYLAAGFWLAVLGVAFVGPAAAQSAAFTYQGRLNDSGTPANGSYDLAFTLLDSSNQPGTVIAGPVTNSAVAVTNGLFTVTLDFGPGVFPGAERWLEIAVQPAGGSGFAMLSPRQPVTFAPYAGYAQTAGNVSGVISNSSLPSNPNFSGTVTGSGFSGNGAGLTNLNAAALTGTIAAGQLPDNAALLDGNQTFTGRNYFAGIQARGGPPGAYGANNNGYAFTGNGGDDDSGMFSTANGEIGFFNNAAEVMRIVNGYVGIGTTNPAAPLEVTGANPFPQLAVTVPSNSPYGAFLSLDASAAPGGKNYLIFSTANLAGEGQGQLIFQNHSDGVPILCLSSNGNVGIGTLQPQAKLQVQGNIQFGSGGTNYAAGSAENLRIVRGIIDPTGKAFRGTGYTVVSNSLGFFTVTFTPPFSDIPAVTVSAGGASAYWNNLGNGTFEMHVTGVGSATPTSTYSMFIAVGPP